MNENVYEREFRSSVDPAFGFREVVVRTSIPKLEQRAISAAFAEHVFDRKNKRSTQTVIAVQKGAVVVSRDLGKKWKRIKLAEIGKADLFNCFTTSDGVHILQAKAPRRVGEELAHEPGGNIYRYSADWELLDISQPSQSRWHGSRSVDEANGVIMFADYPNNKDKYTIDKESPDEIARVDLHIPGVHRSTDNGKTWTTVFKQDWREIRHFHTLMADPYSANTWWLSSGDNTEECHIWRSDDAGLTWDDVSLGDPSIELHPSFRKRKRSIYRHTDMWITPDELIWGTDDWLGGHNAAPDMSVPPEVRTGSKLYRASKSNLHEPRFVGAVGNPVRSIVDVGLALLVTTEAKHTVLPKPQVFLVSKNDPALVQEIFTVDVERDTGSGFTFSRASRSTCDNVFFSYRSGFDFCTSPTRILKWEIEFS